MTVLDEPARPVPRQSNPAADLTHEISTGTPVLAARNLRAVYPSAGSDIVAVDDVSLTVDQGEVFGIAGESGCGKSTLAAVLSLTERPGLQVIAGELEVAGDRVDLLHREGPPRAWRGTVCLLPQSAMNALSPTVRIRDLAVDVVRAHAVLSRGDALDWAASRLEQLDLPTRVLSSYPHQLSGGMRQRVVIMLSTLVSPRVLIADEPTSALDVSSQRVVLDLLRELLRQGLVGAIVLVTHDLSLLRTVADRIGVMYAGQLVEVGSADEIVNRARHPYTNALLHSVLDLTTRRVPRITGIAGDPPDLAALPAGCRFHPRCGLAMPLCGQSSPPRVGDTMHYATCWLTREHQPVAAELAP